MTDTEKKLAFLLATSPHLDTVDGSYDEAARDLIANGVVPVVRCKDCKHGVWDKDEELWKCVISADWNEEVAEYIGFLEYHEADDFCSFGERRAE